jgi:multidrug efflux system membrane fusion protein
VRDEATLQNTQRDLQRYADLYHAGVIPQQQYNTQQSQVKVNEANIQADAAQIQQARLNIDYCHIKAPITGRVGIRNVDPGNMVHASDANGLVVITQMQPIAAQFTLPEDTLPSVTAHGGAPIPVEAWSRDNTTKIATGRLLTVDNQIDPNTGTYRCKAVFDNADGALYPNQFVNARLLAETRKGVVVAPTAALQRSPQSTFVYVVKLDEAKSKDSKIAGAVEIRNVTPGPSEGNETIIEKGLEPDETVVTDGVDKLTPGARVTIPPARSGRGKEVP